jgi:hypothetical protein
MNICKNELGFLLRVSFFKISVDLDHFILIVST